MEFWNVKCQTFQSSQPLQVGSWNWFFCFWVHREFHTTQPRRAGSAKIQTRFPIKVGASSIPLRRRIYNSILSYIRIFCHYNISYHENKYSTHIANYMGKDRRGFACNQRIFGMQTDGSNRQPGHDNGPSGSCCSHRKIGQTRSGI